VSEPVEDLANVELEVPDDNDPYAFLRGMTMDELIVTLIMQGKVIESKLDALHDRIDGYEAKALRIEAEVRAFFTKENLTEKAKEALASFSESGGMMSLLSGGGF
jgi:hypothetical protein